jgi:hypothetical protein
MALSFSSHKAARLSSQKQQPQCRPGMIAWFMHSYAVATALQYPDPMNCCCCCWLLLPHSQLGPCMYEQH